MDLTQCLPAWVDFEVGTEHVLELTEGIIGMRGFVPLETPLVFCSTQCLKDSFNGGKGRVVQRTKIP